MTCSSCGKPLAQDARFCSGCGAQASFVPPMPPMYPMRTRCPRVASNIQTLGTLWLVYAGIRALTGLGALLFLHGFFGSHLHGNFNFGWSPFGREWPSAMLPIAMVSLLVSVGCVALTGYALLTRQPWGRILAIVFGIFALFNLPFGMPLGVYTLWTLMPACSGAEYAELAYAAGHGGAGRPPQPMRP
jgi:hypothetical protein